MSILTIADLIEAEQRDYQEVQECLNQVTVEEDLYKYQAWLHDEEVTTVVPLKLERTQQRKPGVHPSSASKVSPCLLKLYYECREEIPAREPFKPETQRIWDLGTYMHVVHQTWFSDMYGDQFEDEVKLSGAGGYITSATDGIFSFPTYRFIIEIKTIKEGGNYGWATVQNKPMDDHIRQANFYMHLADVPFALIFYINKNNCDYKEHAIAYSQTLWEDMWYEVVEPVIGAAYEEGAAVSASPGWGCRWCGYAYHCPEKKTYAGGKDVEW